MDDPNQVRTWRQLRDFLNKHVADDRLDDDLAVDVLTEDGMCLETYSSRGSVFLDIATNDHDSLDAGHLIFVVET